MIKFRKILSEIEVTVPDQLYTHVWIAPLKLYRCEYTSLCHADNYDELVFHLKDLLQNTYDADKFARIIHNNEDIVSSLEELEAFDHNDLGHYYCYFKEPGDTVTFFFSEHVPCSEAKAIAEDTYCNDIFYREEYNY